MSTIYGNVTYVPRSIYADREEMLKNHANLVAGNNDSVVWIDDIIEASTVSFPTSPTLAEMDARNHSRKILIINEGAADSVAILGNDESYFCEYIITLSLHVGMHFIRPFSFSLG